MKHIMIKVSSIKHFWENITHFFMSMLIKNNFAKKIITIVHGFNTEIVGEVTETDLRQIFNYNFAEPSKTFFIIWNSASYAGNDKFIAENIDDCYRADWYALIRPDSSSYLIFPWSGVWKYFQMDGKGQFHTKQMNGKMWEQWGGTFQLDKNIGKSVFSSTLPIDTVLQLFKETHS